MSNTNDDPQNITDDELETLSGGGTSISAKRQSEPVGMFPPGVGDLKPKPPSPVPIPYPNIPNTKD